MNKGRAAAGIMATVAGAALGALLFVGVAASAPSPEVPANIRQAVTDFCESMIPDYLDTCKLSRVLGSVPGNENIYQMTSVVIETNMGEGIITIYMDAGELVKIR